ncbi:hypothetical protein DFH06DRAFT_1487246 [Mycena polygramma]|nr:hypothetical protein DFH06DRAFT_1487246 [Mycena polygramma]
MHPALRLETLIASQRIVATAVSAPHPSARDIDRFATVLEKTLHPSIQFLPVLHTLLDPARIPTSDELESCSADVICAVNAGLLSIKTILRMKTAGKVPPETGEDLWPRLCFGFIAFSSVMCEHPPNEVLITSTPGFQVLAVQAWKLLVQTENVAQNVPKNLFFAVHGFLTRGTGFLDDRIEGAGGSINDLARLTMNHIELAASNGNKPLSLDATWLLHIALDIVFYTDGLDLFEATDPETMQPCAKEPGSDSSHGTLRSLVAQVLAPASVHYHVLKDLALAYVALPDDIGDPAILTPRRRSGLGTIRHFVKDSIHGHECI